MNFVEGVIYDGLLFSENENIPVKVGYASNTSLFIKFLFRKKFIKGKKFRNFTIQLQNRAMELGECVLLPGNVSPHFHGKIVFTANVYDFYSLFREGVLADAKSFFQGLPVMLDLKNKVKKEFSEYISNLSYNLNVYRKYFDDIDFKNSKEPEDVLPVIQQALIDTEGRRFLNFFNEQLKVLKDLVRGYSREEHELHAYYLRRQLNGVITASAFLKHSNMRPRGFAGDSKLMSMIYRNEYEGATVFQKMLHKHAVDSAAARAVRNQKKLVADLVFQTEKNLKLSRKNVKILSVGCGPAAELENILLTPDICERFHFTLLDQDIQALEEASVNIKNISLRKGVEPNHRFVSESVRTMTGISDLASEWGTFHFIYALGLLDYLNDCVAAVLIEKLYQLLEPGGMLLAGNFHGQNPDRTYMDYWMDWPLVYRNEKKMLSFAAQTEGETEIFFDDTKSQMFLKITKS